MSRALSELVAEGHIAAEAESLFGALGIVFYHHPSHRYWRRRAREITGLVSQFSNPQFTAALEHIEVHFTGRANHKVANVQASGFAPVVHRENGGQELHK